ncbi:MAG: WYL domain-containing protein [Actinomycetota bacterium]|nr:WYL domain-containing protein [Actinomycetota bacterium]
MDSATRLLRLLSLLQARPSWTGDELASRTGTTTRTLRRDLTRLRDLGYPVEGSTGPAGGYRLGSGAAMPPLLLDDDEATVVAIGLRAAAATAIVGLEDAAISALGKLEQLLPSRVRRRITDIGDTTLRLDDPEPGRLDALVLAEMAAACRGSQRLRFDYVTGDGRRGSRHTEPYRLVSSERRWYLVAWDVDRRDWRTFRVDRAANAGATGAGSERREPPDAVAFVREGLAVAAYPVRASVLLAMPIDRAADVVRPTVGRLEAVDEQSTMLRIGADDVDWIARYVAGLPCRVRAVGPPELVEALRVLGEHLVADHPAPGGEAAR